LWCSTNETKSQTVASYVIVFLTTTVGPFFFPIPLSNYNTPHNRLVVPRRTFLDSASESESWSDFIPTPVYDNSQNDSYEYTEFGEGMKSVLDAVHPDYDVTSPEKGDWIPTHLMPWRGGGVLLAKQQQQQQQQQQQAKTTMAAITTSAAVAAHKAVLSSLKRGSSSSLSSPRGMDGRQ
jgi:hypothetical protein